MTAPTPEPSSGTTTKPALVPILLFCAITSVLLTVITGPSDFVCLPELATAEKLGKIEAVLRSMQFGIRQPLLFVSLLVGFALLAVGIAYAPFLFEETSSARTIAAFGPLLLLVGGIGWAGFQLSVSNCDGGWNGGIILMQIATGVIVWVIVLLLSFRSSRQH